jgi:hypothetical protein
MGNALTTVYRKGALEAEGFPVADVSAAACVGLDYRFRRRDWL